MVKKVTIMNVLEPFLINPKEKIHLSQIAREIKEPHPTIRQHLNILEDKGILKKENKGRLTLYSLNLENRNIIDYLIISEKNKLINISEREPLIKELSYFLNSNLHENTKAIIFGSASVSIKKASDIDILIIGKFNEKKMNGFSKRINKELHIINVNKLNKISESLKNEIIKKHIIIKGSEELVRWIIW